MFASISSKLVRYWMLETSGSQTLLNPFCARGQFCYKSSQACLANVIVSNSEKRLRTLKDLLALNEVEPPSRSENKVTIVGAGQVGMATAFTLLTQNVTSNVTLIDSLAKRVSGEVLDLDRGSVFLSSGVEIHGSTHYEDSQNSDVCVLAASSLREEPSQNVVQKDAEIFKAIVPRLLKFSPDCVLVVVSHPVDVMTYVAWRVSRLPANRIIGLGTTLDSAQFRTLVARKLGFAPGSVDGWIIGEQGERSIPVWSGVNAAGVRIHDLIPDLDSQEQMAKWNELHTEAVQNGQEVIKLKGYSSWALGLSISAIVRAVLCSSHAVYPVSTLVQGHYGVNKEVFLSLPCVLCKKGIRNIVNQDLTQKEKDVFQKSSELVYAIQQKLHF